MNDINSRIKTIVDNSNMKKGEIAARLNISQPFLSQLCAGVRNPSDRTISDICREFDIREEWLRTGKEPMKESRTCDEVLAEKLEGTLTAGNEDFRKRLIAVLAGLPPEKWSVLEEIAEEVLAMKPTKSASAKATKETDEERMEREAREEADEYYQLRLEEKRRIEAEAKSLDGTGENSSNSESDIA